MFKIGLSFVNVITITTTLPQSICLRFLNRAKADLNKAKAALSNTTTRSDVEMEIVTIDVSYTMGGATLGLSNSEITNDSYTAGDETTETIVALSLAF